jgi:hypothetical protein
LSGEWDFAFDDAGAGLDEAWWRDFPGSAGIIVPFPPESPGSGLGDPGRHPVVWYRRQQPAPGLRAGERLMLRIGACDYEAHVWCNGQLVGHHIGGHLPFSCDLTPSLAGESLEIVIRAEDDPLDVAKPRGKQDWSLKPHAVWYPRTTGLWQPVWLERVPRRHIAALTWSSDLARGVVTCDVDLAGDPLDGERVGVRLTLGDEFLAGLEVAPDVHSCRIEVAIAALGNGIDRGRLLWSPESPVLIDANLSVLNDKREVVDAVGSYLGIREIGTDAGHFLLNGRPYFLRLVLEQGIWPDSHLAAPDDEAILHEVELVKRLGFNGVRVHQKIEDPRFLACCDRLGLVVWEEMPSCYEFSTAAVTRMVHEWPQAVIRDRSHPCIVCWVPLNESWGVPDLSVRRDQQSLARALVDLTRALDPSRPVISNDGWEHLDSDILTIHDYGPAEALRDRYGTAEALERTVRDGWPGPRRMTLGESQRPERPVMVTEFGGLSLTPGPGEEWVGYATVDSERTLADRFADHVAPLLASDALAGFCYTQLTDTFQERNGLLRSDRTPKVPFELVRATLNQVPASTSHELVERARQAAQRAAGALADDEAEISHAAARALARADSGSRQAESMKTGKPPETSERTAT